MKLIYRYAEAKSHERYAIQAWYVRKAGRRRVCRIVLGDDDVINLKAAPNAAALSSTDSIDGLLEDWDANFAVLQRISDALQKEGRRARSNLPACARCRRCGGPERCSTRRRIFRIMLTRCCAPA